MERDNYKKEVRKQNVTEKEKADWRVIGKAIAAYRKKHGLTQKELMARMNRGNVKSKIPNQGILSNLETGKTRLLGKEYYRLTQVVDLPEDLKALADTYYQGPRSLQGYPEGKPKRESTPNSPLLDSIAEEVFKEGRRLGRNLEHLGDLEAFAEEQSEKTYNRESFNRMLEEVTDERDHLNARLRKMTSVTETLSLHNARLIEEVSQLRDSQLREGYSKDVSLSRVGDAAATLTRAVFALSVRYIEAIETFKKKKD